MDGQAGAGLGVLGLAQSLAVVVRRSRPLADRSLDSVDIDTPRACTSDCNRDLTATLALSRTHPRSLANAYYVVLTFTRHAHGPVPR